MCAWQPALGLLRTLSSPQSASGICSVKSVQRGVQVQASLDELYEKCPGQRRLTGSPGCRFVCLRSFCTGWTAASRAPCPSPDTTAPLPCLPQHHKPALQVHTPPHANEHSRLADGQGGMRCTASDSEPNQKRSAASRRTYLGSCLLV